MCVSHMHVEDTGRLEGVSYLRTHAEATKIPSLAEVNKGE